jgi:glycosyltransferase involved in cell wall biosynthesis
LKLFIAAGIFHPETGGPATYLREVLPEFMRAGWDVRVVTFGEGLSEGYGHPLTRIPRKALPLRMVGYASAARPLLDWADVVYIHTPGLPLWGNRRAPRVMKIVGDVAWERAVRLGWVAPTQDIDDFQTRRFDNLLVEWGKASRAREVAAADAVIVPSEYLKRIVVLWGARPERVHVVYNALPGHDLIAQEAGRAYPVPTEGDPVGTGHALSVSPIQTAPSAPSDDARLSARAALSLPLDAPTLLTAARLTPWKGVQHLIPALCAVPDVRLLVAGGGEMLPELRALAAVHGVAERVDFLGNVPREKMPLYLRAADYLALYSGYEGLSHTLLEALREGTPVIASNKGGNPEVVQHGVSGLLVPYVNVEALGAALREAFAPGMRDKLAANAHIGMERFSFERMVRETMQVLESVRS